MWPIVIDRSDPLPLHEQVAAEIRRAIAEGEAGPGDRLPLARDLAAVLARDTRVALFATPMRPEQQAEVEERLAAWSVPYGSDSGNVRVERGKRSELLLRLALAGVPHPHLSGSDEVLAHIGALTPQSVLEAQTRDALAADLALGLRGLDGVAESVALYRLVLPDLRIVSTQVS